FAVELGKTETLNGSLQVDSFIRANMLFTAQKRQVLSKVCSVSGEKYSQVVEKITRLVSK
ncbi:MAG TPA: hypothetical protein VJI67_00400, partial [archaeon]|nr:hypothetical protein [archaeon]